MQRNTFKRKNEFRTEMNSGGSFERRSLSLKIVTLNILTIWNRTLWGHFTKGKTREDNIQVCLQLVNTIRECLELHDFQANEDRCYSDGLPIESLLARRRRHLVQDLRAESKVRNGCECGRHRVGSEELRCVGKQQLAGWLHRRLRNFNQETDPFAAHSIRTSRCLQGHVDRSGGKHERIATSRDA